MKKKTLLGWAPPLLQKNQNRGHRVRMGRTATGARDTRHYYDSYSYREYIFRILIYFNNRWHIVPLFPQEEPGPFSGVQSPRGHWPWGGGRGGGGGRASWMSVRHRLLQVQQTTSLTKLTSVCPTLKIIPTKPVVLFWFCFFCLLGKILFTGKNTNTQRDRVSLTTWSFLSSLSLTILHDWVFHPFNDRTLNVQTARAARNAAQKKLSRDEDEDEYDDSFIDDDSEDLTGEDSDYVPVDSDDSGKEDIKRLQKEAKVFLKRKK